MNQKLYRFSPLIAAVIVFVGYLFTLAPSVIQIDTGELAAAQALAGIPHPTGYPLFAIFGFLFSSLPLGISTIYQLNLLAALWCSAAIMVFGFTLKYIFINAHYFRSPEKQKKQSKNKKSLTQIEKDANTSAVPELEIFIGIIVTGIALGFSKTFWFQATSVEVYSLHILLIISALYLLLKAYIHSLNSGTPHKYWFLFSVILALCFANHMTSILILPLTTFLFFKSQKFTKNSFILLGKMLLVFFPILIALYLYLPIRAAANPAVNWGNPVDFERFFRHFTGKQYQVWMFSSFDESKKQLMYFFSNFASEFHISLLMIATGLFVVLQKFRTLFWIIIILFLSTVGYSINYSISDIDSYFLLAYIALGVPLFFGTMFFISLLKDKNTGYILPVSAFIVFLGLQTYINGETNNQSSVHIYEDYTKAILYSAPKNAMIFSYQWDYFISASYYFQKVEGIRKDVRIIDKELLRRSWYYHQIDRNYPGVLQGIEATVSVFLEDLKPFERDEKFNASNLETGYKAIMKGMISEHLKKGPVFVGPELVENEYQKNEFELPEGYTFVPDLYFYKIVPKDGLYSPLVYPIVNIRVPLREDKYIINLTKIIGGMHVNRAFYDIQANRKDLARLGIKRLNEQFPDYIIPKELLDLLQ